MDKAADATAAAGMPPAQECAGDTPGRARDRGTPTIAQPPVWWPKQATQTRSGQAASL